MVEVYLTELCSFFRIILVLLLLFTSEDWFPMKGKVRFFACRETNLSTVTNAFSDNLPNSRIRHAPVPCRGRVLLLKAHEDNKLVQHGFIKFLQFHLKFLKQINKSFLIKSIYKFIIPAAAASVLHSFGISLIYINFYLLIIKSQTNTRPKTQMLSYNSNFNILLYMFLEARAKAAGAANKCSRN